MTDRAHSLTVCLDVDIREDDLEALQNAIMQIKHVIAVEPNIADPMLWVAEARAKRELGDKLFNVLYGDEK